MNRLLKKYKGYEGTAEIDPEELICFGKIVCIDDLVTYEAQSPAQLQKEFEAAVDDYLQTCQKLGREPGKAFSGLFNVRVLPQQHRAAAARAMADGVSLNAVMGCALDAYLQDQLPGTPAMAITAVNVVVVADAGETDYQSTFSFTPIVGDPSRGARRDH